MSSAFSIALSSLQAQSEAINTVGNNLANINTLGFKGSSVDFEDLMSQYLGASTGTAVGMGVAKPINSQLFTQGPTQNSNSPLATEIQGNGFFVVEDPAGQQLFTRDGDFTIDKEGVLQTRTGERVQGWLADPSGVINSSGVPGDIVLPTGQVLAPVATENFTIGVNLDVASNVTGGAGYSVPVTVVDSLGEQHTLTVAFSPANPAVTNSWNYQVYIPASDIGATGNPVPLLTTTNPGPPPVTTPSPGTITFNSDGTLNTVLDGAGNNLGNNPVTLSVTGLADGASNLSVDWHLFDPNNGGAGTITQFGQASGIAYTRPDGSQAAQLTGVGIQNGGTVVATFSNGQQKVEAQLALASIQNPDSLQNVGNNNLAATALTAIPAIGLPQSGGRGQIVGGALEGSNVDLATQFTNLIAYQSGYQASSRVITTVNQMTQDLMNLIH